MIRQPRQQTTHNTHTHLHTTIPHTSGPNLEIAGQHLRRRSTTSCSHSNTYPWRSWNRRVFGLLGPCPGEYVGNRGDRGERTMGLQDVISNGRRSSRPPSARSSQRKKLIIDVSQITTAMLPVPDDDLCAQVAVCSDVWSKTAFADSSIWALESSCNTTPWTDDHTARTLPCRRKGHLPPLLSLFTFVL